MKDDKYNLWFPSGLGFIINSHVRLDCHLIFPVKGLSFCLYAEHKLFAVFFADYWNDSGWNVSCKNRKQTFKLPFCCSNLQFCYRQTKPDSQNSFCQNGQWPLQFLCQSPCLVFFGACITDSSKVAEHLPGFSLPFLKGATKLSTALPRAEGQSCSTTAAVQVPQHSGAAFPSIRIVLHVLILFCTSCSLLVSPWRSLVQGEVRAQHRAASQPCVQQHGLGLGAQWGWHAWGRGGCSCGRQLSASQHWNTGEKHGKGSWPWNITWSVLEKEASSPTASILDFSFNLNWLRFSFLIRAIKENSVYRGRNKTRSIFPWRILIFLSQLFNDQSEKWIPKPFAEAGFVTKLCFFCWSHVSV